MLKRKTNALLELAIMLMRPIRLSIIAIACISLMAFKLGPTVDDNDRLIFDVRNAFVTSRSDIPAELMQRVHHHVTTAIQTVSRSKVRPRVILAIRIEPVEHSDMIVGKKASSRVNVRATSVSSGEIVAEAKFRATTIGWTKQTALEKLGDGIAQQIIREFRLTTDERPSLLNALSPIGAY